MKHRASRIPLSGADVGPAEARAVLAAVRSRRLALGPRLPLFEARMAEYVGVRHAVAVSSGTAGLHLLVRALGIGPGDEVITSPFSFVASANCVLYEGAKPVFADIEPDTLNIDPVEVERRVTRRTKAIIGVDVFGHPADWDGLALLARRYGLALIEDSCEALGASAGGRQCGGFGDAGVFAFYPNKQMTTGEGGMIVTDSRRVADVCRSMANQGRRVAGGQWLEHVRLGYNYRLDELSAALGLAQLGRIEGILRRRRQVADWYGELLSGVSGVEIPHARAGVSWSPFVYVVRVSARKRNRVMARLRERGIECSDYFRPIHLQPFYQERFGYRAGSFPIAETESRRTLALPFSGLLTRAEVRRVVAALEQELRQR